MKDSFPVARAWLSRVYRANEEIEKLTFRLQIQQSMASRVTSTLTKANVVHSPSPSAMDDSVARIMEAEKALADAFADFLDVTEEVSALLGNILDSDCRKVMERHYISLQKLSDIAYDLNYSPRWVSELHTKGLRIVEGLLKEKDAA